MNRELVDQSQRDRIESATDHSIFVEAGAGSGKTTQMVKRIVALVAEGISITRIVAITFTEKAAAELRNRVRRALELRLDTTSAFPAEEKFRQALDDLDSAPLGTIHSFARRLIAENPITVMVPPGFEVQSDLARQIDHARQWQQERDGIFGAPELQKDFDLLIGLGAKMTDFEELVSRLDDSWHLLSGSEKRELPTADAIDKLLEMSQELLGAQSTCTNPDDRLLAHLAKVERFLDGLEPLVATGSLALTQHLRTFPKFHSRLGAKGNWPTGVVENLRELGMECDLVAQEAFQAVVQPSLYRVTHHFEHIALRRAESRRLRGELGFHDLLVLARDLMRKSEESWTLISQRYDCVIVDEFQDTDSLQAEIVCRLVSENFEPHVPWDRLALRPGSLTTVGDPKQSIYRFRGANIATYFQHRDREPGISSSHIVSLTTNFRSSESIVEWVNAAFSTIIQEEGSIQPEFQALASGPLAAGPNDLAGPNVGVLGTGEKTGKAEEARKREATDIAHQILAASGRLPGVARWTVADRSPNTPEHRPAEPSDICILIPTRRSLPDIEAALRASGIEFVSEASSIVYSTLEIQGLLLAARAIAHTADPGSLVLALRSPVFGVGDDDLLLWRRERGEKEVWNVFTEGVAPDSPRIVGRALFVLKNIVNQLPSLTPADVLNLLATEGLLYEKSLAVGSGAKAWWRRIRYVIDQAEAWYQTTGGSLRDYIKWAELQQESSTKVREAIAPETGDNAVRITTIHMAKGLEYPIVFLGGAMSAQSVNRPATVWNQREELFLHLAKGPRVGFEVETAGYSDAFESEKAAQLAEFRRLLYVACTRAESHLVVSQHRHKTSPDHAFGSLLADLGTADDDMVLQAHDVAPTPAEAELEAQEIINTPPDEWDLWNKGITDQSASPRSRSVTELAHGTAIDGSREFFDHLGITFWHAPEDMVLEETIREESDDPEPQKRKVLIRDEDEPPPTKNGEREQQGQSNGVDSAGESGTGFGQALHWVLELSDLDPQVDLASLSARAANLNGLKDVETLLSAVVSVMETEIIAEARQRPHWLELPMLYPFENLAIEGIADLVFERVDGSLVVVDFKTDRDLSASALNHYWAQLSSYAVILTRVTKKTATECVIFHIPTHGEARTLNHSLVASQLKRSEASLTNPDFCSTS